MEKGKNNKVVDKERFIRQIQKRVFSLIDQTPVLISTITTN